MTIATQEQLDAFHATHYRVDAPDGAFVLRIGVVSPELRWLHAARGVECSAYLTAWNPLGQVAPPAQNAVWQAAMRADLVALGVDVIEGEGRDPASGWAEQSVLALGLGRAQAVRLGERYQQLAVLVCGVDGVPELLLLC